MTVKLPDGSDAEQRYFSRVAEDCERALGPEIELRALEFDSNGDVCLRLKYRLGQADWTTEGHGETVIEAHAALREKLIVDRIRIGVRALYKQGHV